MKFSWKFSMKIFMKFSGNFINNFSGNFIKFSLDFIHILQDCEVELIFPNLTCNILIFTKISWKFSWNFHENFHEKKFFMKISNDNEDCRPSWKFWKFSWKFSQKKFHENLHRWTNCIAHSTRFNYRPYTYYRKIYGTITCDPVQHTIGLR